MNLIALLTNFFEMVAALSTIAVAYLGYQEVRRMRDKDK